MSSNWPPPEGERPVGGWQQPPSSSYPSGATSYQPFRPESQRPPWWRRPAPLVAVGVVAVLMVVAIVVGVALSDSTDHEKGESSSLAGPSVGDALAAVCTPGTYREGVSSILLTATGTGQCFTRSPRDYLYIGQYESAFKADNDTASAYAGPFATLNGDDGSITVFVLLDGHDSAALKPLADLGLPISGS